MYFYYTTPSNFIFHKNVASLVLLQKQRGDSFSKNTKDDKNSKGRYFMCFSTTNEERYVSFRELFCLLGKYASSDKKLEKSKLSLREDTLMKMMSRINNC